MPADTSEIIKHQDADPAGVTWLAKRGPPVMEVVEAKSDWASAFELIAQQLRGALDGTVLAIEHVGSTSVPGLAAKDTLDIDLVVVDPTDESAYAAQLAEAGFRFLLREPAWQEHRLFIREPPQQAVNLHVFGPDAPELVRHRLFRDHLRAHPADRSLYDQAKRDAMRGAREAGGGVADYNKLKQDVVREILDRAYRENGLMMA